MRLNLILPPLKLGKRPPSKWGSRDRQSNARPLAAAAQQFRAKLSRWVMYLAYFHYYRYTLASVDVKGKRRNMHASVKRSSKQAFLQQHVSSGEACLGGDHCVVHAITRVTCLRYNKCYHGNGKRCVETKYMGVDRIWFPLLRKPSLMWSHRNIVVVNGSTEAEKTCLPKYTHHLGLWANAELTDVILCSRNSGILMAQSKDRFLFQSLPVKHFRFSQYSGFLKNKTGKKSAVLVYVKNYLIHMISKHTFT